MKNTVELLRKDLQIKNQKQVVFGTDDINVRTKRIKHQIHNFFSGYTEKKNILIFTNDLTIILPAIIAIWELGSAVVVHDYYPGWEDHEAFKRFYSYIDLVLLPPNGKEKVFLPSLQLKLDDPAELDLKVVVEPSWPAVITHTSGTTGLPRPIKIPHYDAINLVKENINLFEFKDTDRVLHYKTLHHGSLFLNYAIPAMACTKDHFFITIGPNDSDISFLDRALTFCGLNDITFWLIPYNWIRKIPSLLPGVYKLSHLNLITVLGPTTDEIQQIFANTDIKKIYNNFGCTEIGSLFLSATTKDNVDDYNPNKFNIVNSTVDFEFFTNMFKVKYKTSSEWNVISDVFKTDDQNVFWWQGRCNIINNENKYLQVSEITKFVENFLSNIDFSLVPDFELNKFYIAIFGNELNADSHLLTDLNLALSKITGLEKTIHDIDWFPKNFRIGVKISQPLLLYSFRQKNENN